MVSLISSYLTLCICIRKSIIPMPPTYSVWVLIWDFGVMEWDGFNYASFILGREDFKVLILSYMSIKFIYFLQFSLKYLVLLKLCVAFVYVRVYCIKFWVLVTFINRIGCKKFSRLSLPQFSGQTTISNFNIL